jgi:hypothetical protein
MPKPTAAERDAGESLAAAHRVLAHVIEATERRVSGPAPEQPSPDTRNAAAVALGRLGASKGGKARAESLSKAERSKIARNAARARWIVKG